MNISPVGLFFAVCAPLFLGSSFAISQTSDGSYFADPPVVLPQSSTLAADELLSQFEKAYSGMDVEAFLDLFTDDFQNIDVSRRVRIAGIADWRAQTERFMAMHKCARRKHLGRTVSADSIVVEVEWWGILRGSVFGRDEPDRSYRYRGVVFLKTDGGKFSLQLAYDDVETLNQQLSIPTSETAC